MKYLAVIVSVVLAVLVANLFMKQKPYMSDIPEISPNSFSDHKNTPNVILIVMDTVRADHLSLYDYKRDTTPNLIKFSEEATVFANVFSTGAMTLPSHASIFTGLYSRQHGTHNDPPDFPYGHPLDDKFLTLAEILSSNGYLTSGIVSNYGFLNNEFGLHQGFQYLDFRFPLPFLSKQLNFLLRNKVRKLLIPFCSPDAFETVYRDAREINKEVFGSLDKLKHNGKQFFLFINYMDAHFPYIPPAPFDNLFPGKDEKFTAKRYESLYENVLKLKQKVTEKEYNHLVSQYDSEITYIDHNLGKLFSRLKELGLYDNSIIVITSDHGEIFGRRNLLQHGLSVYQDQVSVPLIIRFSNSGTNTIVKENVSIVDIFPTILDELGYMYPSEISGISLKKLKSDNSREIITESYINGGHPNWHQRFNRTEHAIISGPLKFINSTAGKRELYDLLNDPNEEKNRLFRVSSG